MRIRNFSRHPRPRSASVLDLSPRRPTRIEADPAGRPVALELDLAIAVESGYVGLILATPSLLTAGLRPASNAILVTPHDPIEVLRLWIVPTPDTAVDLTPEMPVARLLLLESATTSLIEDVQLDDEIAPAHDPFTQLSVESSAPFGER